MSFRLVPKSVTLNGVMAVTLRYFTEFGKPVFEHSLTASICGGIYGLVYCIMYCMYVVVVKKFMFAISSPGELPCHFSAFCLSAYRIFVLVLFVD